MFCWRFAEIILAADSLGFAFDSGELSTAVAPEDLARVPDARFFAGLSTDAVGEVSFGGLATDAGANGNSPVMASVVTSSLRVAPAFCGGLVGLAMREV